MASIQELKSVVKETLENRGVLGQIKARLRAEVFNALDDQAEARPQLSNENLLINELIREYLEFNKYKYAASVLQAESGQPKTPLDREFLAQELNILEDKETSQVPLLYGVVAHFLSRNKMRGTGTESARPSLRIDDLMHPTSAPHMNGYADEDGADVEPAGLVMRGGHR